jgi:hypothetical protein
MATDPNALMALDNASNNAIAPYTPPDGFDLNPYMVPTTALFETIQQQLPWVPQNLASVASRVFAAGAFPRLRSFTGATTVPSWLQLPANLSAWQQVIQQYLPIEQAFIAGNNALLAQQAATLQSNVDFWNTVATYSGEDAMERIWSDFQNALDSLKASAAGVQTSLGVISAIQAQYGTKLPANYLSQIAAAQAQFQDIKSGATSALSAIPGSVAYAGLGAFAIIAAIGLAVVATVTASVWVYANKMAAAQVQVATLATNLVAWRDQQSESDLRTGKITETQFEARQAQSNTMLQNIKTANGGSTFTRVLKDTAVVAGLVGLGWLAWKIIKRRRASA